MKELLLSDSNLESKDKKVCVRKFMDCLHNLKKLSINIGLMSMKLKTKLETRGREVGCTALIQ